MDDLSTSTRRGDLHRGFPGKWELGNSSAGKAEGAQKLSFLKDASNLSLVPLPSIAASNIDSSTIS